MKFAVDDQRPIRQWQVIAEELSRELDSRKICQLTIELDKALQKQDGWNSSSGAGSGASIPGKQ